MREWLRCLVVINAVSLLLACSEEPKNPTAKTSIPAVVETEKNDGTAPSTKHSGSAHINLQPDQPTSSDCLQAIAQGQPVQIEYQWTVNGETLVEPTGRKLCNDFFKRDDEVTVSIASDQDSPTASVTIGNSAPIILEVAATADQALQRGNITINVVADDVDGDEVKFRYQWLINGEEDLFDVTATLPKESYIKGDTVQVRIIPYDAFSEGTAYESAVLTVPNAPPNITSQPPQQFETLEYTYQVLAADPDDAQLSYSLEEAPEGMAINEAGLVTWPLTGVRAGTYQVKIAVEDPEGTKTTQEFSITLGKLQD